VCGALTMQTCTCSRPNIENDLRPGPRCQQCARQDSNLQPAELELQYLPTHLVGHQLISAGVLRPRAHRDAVTVPSQIAKRGQILENSLADYAAIATNLICVIYLRAY